MQNFPNILDKIAEYDNEIATDEKFEECAKIHILIFTIFQFSSLIYLKYLAFSKFHLDN